MSELERSRRKSVVSVDVWRCKPCIAIRQNAAVDRPVTRRCCHTCHTRRIDVADTSACRGSSRCQIRRLVHDGIRQFDGTRPDVMTDRRVAAALRIAVGDVVEPSSTSHNLCDLRTPSAHSSVTPPESPPHCAAMVCFELARLGVQGFEFLVQRFELLLEVLVAHGFARRDADVAAGVERPALRFDFLERGGRHRPGTSA